MRIVNGRFWLGHDRPQYAVEQDWLDERRDKLLLHCKNFAAATQFTWSKFLSFSHTSDPFVFMSDGRIWLHEPVEPDENCIVPLITQQVVSMYPYRAMAGVCSDFIELCKERFG